MHPRAAIQEFSSNNPRRHQAVDIICVDCRRPPASTAEVNGAKTIEGHSFWHSRVKLLPAMLKSNDGTGM